LGLPSIRAISTSARPAEPPATDTSGINLRREVAALEAEALRLALDRAHGRAAGAARLLGEVGRGRAADPGSTVRAMMRRLGLR